MDFKPGGQPKAVRLLGEDLVMFRDDTGRMGLLGLRCSHRLTSLGLAKGCSVGIEQLPLGQPAAQPLGHREVVAVLVRIERVDEVDHEVELVRRLGNGL